MQISFPDGQNSDPALVGDSKLQRVIRNLAGTLERDQLVIQTVNQLQYQLEVDRVVVYYFYRQWKGQVTFEALSHPRFSIFGSTGPDDCFNHNYAEMYLVGRVRAIADIETADIAECHRNFLRELQVRANLVAPVLTSQGLWGLLVAHHCQSIHLWSDENLQAIQQAAAKLAISPAISGSKPI